MIIKDGLHSPLELIVLEYDDKDSNIVHYTMKEQYHQVLQILKDL